LIPNGVGQRIFPVPGVPTFQYRAEATPKVLVRKDDGRKEQDDFFNVAITDTILARMVMTAEVCSMQTLKSRSLAESGAAGDRTCTDTQTHRHTHLTTKCVKISTTDTDVRSTAYLCGLNIKNDPYSLENPDIIYDDGELFYYTKKPVM